MKKLISLCAVLCVVCSCMVGTAFAADYPDISFRDGYEYLAIRSDEYEFVLFEIPNSRFNDSDFRVGEMSVFYNGCNIYYVDYGENEWVFDESDTRGSYTWEKMLYSTFDVYVDDELAFVGTPLTPSIPAPGGDVGGIADIASDVGMSGVLGEVLGMVAIVVPVIVVLFGIRKGIAFLFARIRGV